RLLCAWDARFQLFAAIPESSDIRSATLRWFLCWLAMGALRGLPGSTPLGRLLYRLGGRSRVHQRDGRRTHHDLDRVLPSRICAYTFDGGGDRCGRCDGTNARRRAVSLALLRFPL